MYCLSRRSSGSTHGNSVFTCNNIANYHFTFSMVVIIKPRNTTNPNWTFNETRISLSEVRDETRILRISQGVQFESLFSNLFCHCYQTMFENYSWKSYVMKILRKRGMLMKNTLKTDKLYANGLYLRVVDYMLCQRKKKEKNALTNIVPYLSHHHNTLPFSFLQTFLCCTCCRKQKRVVGVRDRVMLSRSTVGANGASLLLGQHFISFFLSCFPRRALWRPVSPCIYRAVHGERRRGWKGLHSLSCTFPPSLVNLSLWSVDGRQTERREGRIGERKMEKEYGR